MPAVTPHGRGGGKGGEIGKRGRQEFSMPDYLMNMRAVPTSAKNGEARERSSTDGAPRERSTPCSRFMHMPFALEGPVARRSSSASSGAAVTGTSGKDGQGGESRRFVCANDACVQRGILNNQVQRAGIPCNARQREPGPIAGCNAHVKGAGGAQTNCRTRTNCADCGIRPS